MIRREIQTLAIVMILILGMTLPGLASSVGGELSTSMINQWDDESEIWEQGSIPTEFLLELEDSLDFGGKVYFSAKGVRDWKTKTTDFALEQLWFSGYTDRIDYKLGRQVINWGTADGFNPTNYFARIGSDALTSGQLGTEPFWTGQATYYGANWSLTGVMVPYFSPQKIDPLMKNLMLDTNPQAALLLDAIDNVKKPNGIGANSEYALRLEAYLAGWDLQASFFTGFEPLPGLQTKFDPTATPVPIKFVGEYRRQYFLGLAVAGTIGDAGLWGEVAYGGPEAFETSDNPMETILSINEKYLQAVVGADYTLNLGTGLLVQGQYIYRGQGSLFSPYGEKLDAAHYIYSRLGYDFTPDSSIELVVIHGFEDNSGLLMPTYTHRFPYSITLKAGFLKAYGKENKEFSPIPTQARVGISYKF